LEGRARERGGNEGMKERKRDRKTEDAGKRKSERKRKWGVRE